MHISCSVDAIAELEANLKYRASLVQSNHASAAALKIAGQILRLRVSRLQLAQRPFGLHKLAGKAKKASNNCRERLARVFHWFTHAKQMHARLQHAHGDEFIALQLGASSADVLAWLSKPWLNEHCSNFGAIDAAVGSAMTSLLGAAGASLLPGCSSGMQQAQPH